MIGFIKPLFVLISVLSIFSSPLKKGFNDLKDNDYKKAKEHFDKALEKGDYPSLAHFGLAKLCFTKSSPYYDPYQSYDYLEKSIKEVEQTREKQKLKEEWLNMGYSFANLNELKKNIERQILINLQVNNDIEKIQNYIKDFPKAHNKSLAIAIRDSVAFQKAIHNGDRSSMEKFIEDFPSAPQREKALNKLIEIEFREAVKANDIKVYDAFIKKYTQAPEAKRAIEMRNTLAYNEVLKKENELIKKEKQLHQAEADKQRFRVQYLSAIGIAVLILLGLIVAGYLTKRKDNLKIKGQKEEIEEAHRHTIDSLNYAKRIQDAILPKYSLMQELFNDLFLLYKPKDIVSGDFYWCGSIGEYKAIAAADCTGHGIPGAFMSMIGNILLNQSILRKEIVDPAEALSVIRKDLMEALDQYGQEGDTSDGMDMSLCVWHEPSMTLHYAGAFNPLVYIQNGEMKVVKADRQPIGYYMHKSDRPFTSHAIQLNKGDTFYMFSDGFPDQNGGEQNKKLGIKKFKNLIKDIHDKPMEDQKAEMQSFYDQWTINTTQLDDILVLAVKV